jgi:hypothetical protein
VGVARETEADKKKAKKRRVRESKGREKRDRTVNATPSKTRCSVR